MLCNAWGDYFSSSVALLKWLTSVRLDKNNHSFYDNYDLPKYSEEIKAQFPVNWNTLYRTN